MKLNPQDLEKIASLTLDHYNQRAEEFWHGTRDHDVQQNIATLLQWIEGKTPFTILDFGCGPGRDLKVFSELGHLAVGLEGAAHFAVMARTYSGCEVWQQDFLRLDLPDNHFDGVYANASLFHVPSQELPRVLLELHASLKPGGVLFSSNPRGNRLPLFAPRSLLLGKSERGPRETYRGARRHWSRRPPRHPSEVWKRSPIEMK